MFTRPEILERVLKARRSLIQDGNEFYGVLSSYLEPVERLDIKTAATDGKAYFYNPDYVASLDHEEVIGLTAHEVSHVSLLHHARIRPDWDLQEANIAADLAINQDLKRQGFKLPKGALFDPQYDGMGFEEIYAARQQAKRKEQERNGPAGQPGKTGSQNGQPGSQNGSGNQPGNEPGNGSTRASEPGNGQDGQGSGNEHGIGGIMRPGNGSEAEAEAAKEEWRVRVTEAAAVAKRANAGKMPGNVARILETAREPQLDVRELLARWIDSSVVTTTTWARPNRRLIGQGIYLPSHTVDGLEHVLFLVDTSGSIDGHMLANGAAEIIAAHGDGRIQRLTVIFTDTRVQAVQEFERGDDIALSPAGGGGTRFAAVFAHVAEHYPNATAIVFLTDLLVSDHAEWIEPACPVLWAVHGDSRAFEALTSAVPFGESVYIGRLE